MHVYIVPNHINLNNLYLVWFVTPNGNPVNWKSLDKVFREQFE